MIDLILFVFMIGVYGAGFWCGQRYNTVSNMLEEWYKALKS